MLWLYVHYFVFFLLLPGVFSFDCAFSFLSLSLVIMLNVLPYSHPICLRFFAVLFVCLFLPYSHPLIVGFSHNTSVSGRNIG